MTPYYEDDACVIFHGDCREVPDWLTADVLVTDPPYGIGYVSGGPRVNVDGVRSMTERKPVLSDEDTAVRDEALALWGDRPALVFGVWRVARPPSTRQRLLWIKENTNPALGGTPWSSADEEVYVLGDGWVGPRCLNFIPTREARSGCGGMAAQVGHPTPKPTELMRQLIAHCPPGVIADPFMGSGSTILAARTLGRRVIAVEKDERYCEIAASRLSQEVLAL